MQNNVVEFRLFYCGFFMINKTAYVNRKQKSYSSRYLFSPKRWFLKKDNLHQNFAETESSDGSLFQHILTEFCLGQYAQLGVYCINMTINGSLGKTQVCADFRGRPRAILLSSGSGMASIYSNALPMG